MSSGARCPERLIVDEPSQAGAARRAAVALAAQLGFDETDQGTVATVVTEIATNLARHARDGEILMQAVERQGAAAVQILSVDRGPGMANVGACLRDGYSTGGTAGTGLGAIRRMASMFDIHSSAPGGTVLLAECWPRRLPGPAAAVEVSAVCLPSPGESVCGDAWSVARSGERTLVLVADGLGHGPHAAEASTRAVQVLQQQAGAGVLEIVQAMHAALRSTRGAAVAVAEIDLPGQVLRFAGVGNVAAAVLGAAGNRSLVSYNGIVGHEIRKLQDFTVPWTPDARLVMHSDGLSGRWDLEKYPGLWSRRGAVVAGILYRDFRRERDDVTVLVASAAGQGRPV